MAQLSARRVALTALRIWRTGSLFADSIISKHLRETQLSGSDRGFALELFYGTLRNFRRVASAAHKWWDADGAKQRYAEMLQAQQEPPLLLNLVWTDYSRMATEIATAHAARRVGTA